MAPLPVSITSPWKMGAPSLALTLVPSVRVMVTVPWRTVIWPMDSAPAVAAWASSTISPSVD